MLPLWEASEEAAHVEFVRYIQEHHALPIYEPLPPSPTPPSAPGSEFVQVPLYYLLLAGMLSPIWLPPDAVWHRNPYVTWEGHPNRYATALHRFDEDWPYRGLTLFVHLGRFVSTLVGLVVVFATYGIV